MDREDALMRRIAAQQLGRPVAPRPLTDAAVFDLGIQDTGRDGASWALANRGVPLASPSELESSSDVALVWTLRSSPHYYRRTDLPEVLVATSPMSDRDAAKRVFGPDKPWREAGINAREGLAEVARQLHDVVTEPMPKGEVSTRVSARLTAPYLRDCATCAALHSWEVPFRIGALYAGLELEPGTSPPVLRRIPDWPRDSWGPAADPFAAPDRLQVIRGYLRLLGPAGPKDVAMFLDAPVAEVKAHWPAEAVPVEVEGTAAWSLPGPEPDAAPSDLVRLLGPFDLLLQGRDRALLVPEPARHQALWPTIGRPGAVLVGTEVVGTWRPKAAGRKLTVSVETWRSLTAAERASTDDEAERLAAHRGLSLVALSVAA
ncbi:winged helix DNA-binding domain-containing protein [uncultured Friedmanniella sp.]|uniref:winged helix DNA-binding domain-containing protein n=1 Tax=uncultured Friedmanniella sp. TaxID=335381 RepID=UPI0035C96D80